MSSSNFAYYNIQFDADARLLGVMSFFRFCKFRQGPAQEPMTRSQFCRNFESGKAVWFRSEWTIRLMCVVFTFVIAKKTLPNKWQLTTLFWGQFYWQVVNEPPRDKTNKLTVRPAKTHISLGIRPVWSESSLCAQWVAKDPSFLHAYSEDSDQTGRMPRLIWVFAGRTPILLVLSWGGSYISLSCKFELRLAGL